MGKSDVIRTGNFSMVGIPHPSYPRHQWEWQSLRIKWARSGNKGSMDRLMFDVSWSAALGRPMEYCTRGSTPPVLLNATPTTQGMAARMAAIDVDWGCLDGRWKVARSVLHSKHVSPRRWKNRLPMTRVQEVPSLRWCKR